MGLWLSVPTIAIPTAGSGPDPLPVHSTLSRIHECHGMPFEPHDDGLALPRFSGLAEDLAAEAVRTLLLDERDRPSVLVDCRSSPPLGGPAPTYLLAERCGLSKVLPVAFGSAGGAELAFALQFLATDPECAVNAIVTASQVVTGEVDRLDRRRAVLGDAAAALWVHSDAEPAATAAWRLVRIVTGAGPRTSLRDLADRALAAEGRCRSDVEWQLISPHSESAPLPTPAPLLRQLWPSVDFGSADILVSLRSAYEQAKSLGGLGCIGINGDFGAVAVALLEVCHGR